MNHPAAPFWIFRSTPSKSRQTGISLIIVMVMLIVIGLTSAAAIRNATTGEKFTNNIRVQNLAQQYAEAALRYCEIEMGKATADRVATLADANILTVAVGAATGWENTVTWTGTGGASASKTVLLEARVKSSDSAFKPSKMPECVVEKQTLADTTSSYVITARGFSPDYTADSSTGITTGGSVVWLQSILPAN
jgi:type IV pilus assembly protein PilX